MVDAYLIVNGAKILFRDRQEQNLHPLKHAEICKEALERRGYTVEGPFEGTELRS